MNERLDLLLASAEDGRPVLDEGLPADSAERAPKPKKAVRGDDAPTWRRTDADPNDLPAQRWALVAPEGREGDRLLDAITPLIRLREEEQGAKAMVYRVPAEMDARASVSWKDEVYWAEDVDEEDRPLYLTMLGDLHQVSLELQHSLSNCAAVGRVHFADGAREADLDRYAAYARKVVRFAREGTAAEQPDLLFFVARDGTKATMTGDARLVAPSLEAAERSRGLGRLPVADVRSIEADAVDDLLAAGATDRPSVLLSVSHGLGAPRRGWPSEEEAFRRQGALVLGPNEILDADRLKGKPFLPGGAWFYLACFGAGTPASSAYHAWLTLLSQEGVYRGKMSDVLASLPAPGERPFLAALPQAALANPEGPLAVIGHVDLAWTYGFSSAQNLNESRKSRIFSALEVMAKGSRIGVSIEALMRFYREANDALMAGYQLEAASRAEGQRESTDHKERAHFWMLRNDLRGYVLLGDPAARLPIARNTVRLAKASGVATVTTSETSSDKPLATRAAAAIDDGTALGIKEAALLSLLRGEETPAVVAKRAGVPLERLWVWFDVFRALSRAR